MAVGRDVDSTSARMRRCTEQHPLSIQPLIPKAWHPEPAMAMQTNIASSNYRFRFGPIFLAEISHLLIATHARPGS